MKLKLLILICFICLGISPVYANEILNVYVFTQGSSEYCQNALAYLEKLQQEDYKDKIQIIKYEVYDANWNQNSFYVDVMQDVADQKKDGIKGYPYIVIGSNYSVNGFDESYEDAIKNAINKEIENPSDDLVALTITKLKARAKKDNYIVISILTALIAIAAISAKAINKRRKAI